MINRILMPLCLVLAMITSCGGQETPSAQTTTPTLTDSDTPSQTEGSFPVRSLTGESTEFADFDEGFEELSPGTYMLAMDHIEYDFYDIYYYDIYYYSLDGQRLGKMLSLNMSEPFYSEYSQYFSGDPQSPLLQLIYYNHSGQFLIQILDLKTEETLTWQVDISESALANGSTHCEWRPFPSPSKRWLAGYCELGTGQYIYLIDLLNGTGKLVSPPPGPCQPNGKFVSTWVTQDWSTDEESLFVKCWPGRVSEGESRGCLISMQSQEFTACRDPFYDAVISWSPDGSKVVMESRSQEFFYDENTSLYVTNAACLTDSDACDKYISLDIHINPRTWYYIWGKDGRNLYWSQYPLLGAPPGFAGTLDGYTEIGVSDVDNGTTRIITQGAPKGSGIEKLSPDGKWIILKEGGGDWWRFNLESKSLRRLFQVTGDSKPSFLGWIEIP